MSSNERPSRKRNRLEGFDYSSCTFYFVTICAEGRKHLFASAAEPGIELNDAGRMILRQWGELPERVSGILTLDFVVMPNHVHGIIHLIRGARADSAQQITTLSAAVGAFKSLTTLEYIHLIKAGRLPRFDGKVWQRSFHDHVIRSDEDMRNVQEYIEQNPQSWHLDMENPESSGRNEFYGLMGLQE